jgi:AraC-like DNA-binding protein
MKHFADMAIFPGAELELIAQFMSARGLEEKKWLMGSGLESVVRIDTDAAISLRQFDVVYRNVYRLCASPSLGIEFGQALNLSRWGMLSAALLCANTLGHALAIAEEFRGVLRSRFTMENQMLPGFLEVSILPALNLDFPVNERFAYEVLLGTLQSMISNLLGKPFRFSNLKLPYSRPEYFHHYAQVAEGKVVFNAEVASFAVPKPLVIAPLPLSNRVTRKNVIQHCYQELERVEHTQSGNIVLAVRQIISQSNAHLGLEEVAEKLSMSSRTLRRQLQQSNIQFRELCKEQRQNLALGLISSGTQSIAVIGQRCGFSDSASFHKAFKRWTGKTPAQYRKQLQKTEK